MRKDKAEKRAMLRKAHRAQYKLLRYLKAKNWHTPLLGSKKKDIVRILRSHKIVDVKFVDNNQYLIDAATKLLGKSSLYKTKNLKATNRNEDFLDSWAWKKLRYEVLKEHGRRCMCCGITPDQGAVICVDHIKPRHTHPELALDRNNLQVLCYDCNKGKGAWDQTDWRS